jgi:flavin reductase (DIM6/NTAB) family NADH-FMN oxidoreductase RutF
MITESLVQPPGRHDIIDPAILYFGTPVALLSTVGPGGAVNLAPMSSIFWLGHTAVLGMGARSQTTRNLLDTGECVINLPSDAQVDAVDRLALTTGRTDVSARKHAAGYRHVAEKFAHARLTPVPSDKVVAPQVLECPVRMEAAVLSHQQLHGDVPGTGAYVFELEVVRVHVHRSVRLEGTDHRVDPDRWRPLMMSFQKFYGLGSQVHPSRLSDIDEEWYRG